MVLEGFQRLFVLFQQTICLSIVEHVAFRRFGMPILVPEFSFRANARVKAWCLKENVNAMAAWSQRVSCCSLPRSGCQRHSEHLCHKRSFCLGAAQNRAKACET